MKVIKIRGITDSYPEPIEGTNEWYYCRESKYIVISHIARNLRL